VRHSILSLGIVVHIYHILAFVYYWSGQFTSVIQHLFWMRVFWTNRKSVSQGCDSCGRWKVQTTNMWCVCVSVI